MEPEIISETISEVESNNIDESEFNRNESFPEINDSIIETGNDPLSLENENERELELMDEISKLQFELKNAQIKMTDLQNNVLQLNSAKIIADSFLKVRIFCMASFISF
mgnify:CR=1 FL=1